MAFADWLDVKLINQSNQIRISTKSAKVLCYTVNTSCKFPAAICLSSLLPKFCTMWWDEKLAGNIFSRWMLDIRTANLITVDDS